MKINHPAFHAAAGHPNTPKATNATMRDYKTAPKPNPQKAKPTNAKMRDYKVAAPASVAGSKLPMPKSTGKSNVSVMPSYSNQLGKPNKLAQMAQ